MLVSERRRVSPGAAQLQQVLSIVALKSLSPFPLELYVCVMSNETSYKVLKYENANQPIKMWV